MWARHRPYRYRSRVTTSVQSVGSLPPQSGRRKVTLRIVARLVNKRTSHLRSDDDAGGCRWAWCRVALGNATPLLGPRAERSTIAAISARVTASAHVPLEEGLQFGVGAAEVTLRRRDLPVARKALGGAQILLRPQRDRCVAQPVRRHVL
jgi:hypothetical protein